MELHPNNHHHHLQQQQQQQQQPPPPAAPHKPPAEHDLKCRPLVPLSFSNGSLKKHRPFYPPPPPHHNHAVYRECMKNHAASLGGHALDGCGEFMPSPDASPAHPASLTCAACGCHRNFHRRLLHAAPDHLHPHPLPLPLPLPPEREAPDDAAADDDDGDEAVDDDDAPEDAAACSSPPPPTASAGHQYYSAPHMLMALSAGIPGGPSGSSPASATPVAGGASPAVGVGSLQLPRKRFRSKFSPLQKDRMQELSERLGWRMQRRDEALVEDCCREIGVSRAVFKVWMHNNKHNFVGGPSSRRAASGGGAPAAAGGGGGGEATSSSGGVIGTAAAGVNGVSERNGVNGDDQNGGGGEHALNSSSPSSS